MPVGYGRAADGELPCPGGSGVLSVLECVGDERSGTNWGFAEYLPPLISVNWYFPGRCA